MSAAAAVLWSLGLLNAGAAEFGPQQVRSGPGQPLRAVIVLGNVSQAEADGLSVKLAPREAFRQAGLRYDPTLDKLSVSISPTGGREAGYSGTYLVHVDSAEPVGTSFLDLLLVLEWRTGRQSNAVTLSAIPEASAGQPQAVVPAAANAQTSAASTASNAPSTSAPSRRAAGPATAEGTRKVERGDSLSSIAREYTGGEGGTTLAQMMTALFEANRSAFIGNDPNRLRLGATLTRPADAQVQSVPAAQARKFVSTAREQFDAYRARLAESTAQQGAPAAGRSAQGAIEAGKAPEAAVPATRDELKLSRPGKAGAGGTAGRTGGSEEEQIAQGKAQAEAQGRVSELQKNVADLQKLLSVKNQAVANLEQQAATASGVAAQEKTAKSADGKTMSAPSGSVARPTAAAGANGDANTAGGAPSDAAVAASGAAASAALADASASEATAAAPASDVAVAPASAPAAESKPAPNAGMNWRALTRNPYVLPGAGALVALLGLWWLMRRRRAEPPAGQPGQYDDGHDGQRDAETGSDPSSGAAALAGAAGVAAASAAALYAANQGQADEHLPPEAGTSWPAPEDDVAALEDVQPDAVANEAAGSAELNAWEAEQDALSGEAADGLAEGLDDASADAAQNEGIGAPAEPLVTEAKHAAPAVSAAPQTSSEAAGEADIDWDAAFAEQAGEVPVAHDDPVDATLSSLDAPGTAAAIGGAAASASLTPSAARTAEAPKTGATPEGGVAGMLGDLDLGIPGQPANVGTISSDALPSLSKGIGSVQFTMAPPGDPRLEQAHGADSGDMAGASDSIDSTDAEDDFDGELSDADFDAAMQQAQQSQQPQQAPQSASMSEVPRGYADAAHEAPSLRPMSFDLSDFSLDLKGDDATSPAPAFVGAPALPDGTGQEALIEHVTLDPQQAPTSQTSFAQAPAAPQVPQTVQMNQASAPVPDIAAATPSSEPIAPRAAPPDVPDEFHTKLELATAYQSIGDDEGARELLEEVIAGGDAAQQSVARARLAELGK
ncbi:hypothetical protein AB870_20025 [Pandoraea faecigallinarum]|uniref:FimV N-terminal domain-containing protein n=1 Tax=Pandoraea faecigallinarum TaxID=656179 RepID=A0A0H3WUK1_9BURK|nr:hypothetical protein AB870_20025 [Pandoraea faecigallinarum]